MAATIVAENANHTSALASGDTLAISASAGSALFVAVACNTKTRSVTSITDSNGHALTLLDGSGGSGFGNLYVFWNPSLPANITSVTTAYSGTTKISWGSMEVSGLAGTVDGTPAAQDNASATSASQNYTTSGGDSFVLAGIAVPGTPSADSVDSPFTLEASTHATGSGISETLAWAEGAAGTYTATFHLSAASGSTTFMGAFDVAGGASPATIILGEAVSTPAAFGVDLSPGGVTLGLGEAVSTPAALGLDLAPGAVTLILGEAASTPAAFGVDLRSTTTLDLGIATSSPSAFGVTLSPGGVIIPAGIAVSTPAALGPDLVPGGVTLILGEASSTAQAFGIHLAPVTTLALGKATSTPEALGADLSPGGVSLVLGVAQSAPVARGVSLAPGAVTITLGEAVSIAQAFGLHISLLIPASPYPDPRNQIQVVFSANNAPMSPAVNQIQLGTSRNFTQLNPSINSIIAIEEA